MKNLTDKLPPRAEWDFSKCPEHLLHHCVAYEYGREVVGLKEVYSLAKRFNASFSKDRSWRMDRSLRRAIPRNLGLSKTPVNIPMGFPQVPFLRAEFKSLSGPNDSEIELPFELSWRAAKTQFEVQSKGCPQDGPYLNVGNGIAVLAAFIIPHDRPKEEVMSFFSEWLDRYHPHIETRGKSEFKTWKKSLKDLAAFRIFKFGKGRGLTQEQAVEATQSILGEPLIGKPTDWGVYAKRAKNRIRLWSKAEVLSTGYYRRDLEKKAIQMPGTV